MSRMRDRTIMDAGVNYEMEKEGIITYTGQFTRYTVVNKSGGKEKENFD